jgi:hypothetical protein
MKSISGIAVAAFFCVVSAQAQTRDFTNEVLPPLPPQPPKKTLEQQMQEKLNYIKRIEQAYGITFVRETPSKNGLFARWQFLAPAYNGIPVVIDVNAYPNPDQMLSAMGGAEGEAESIFTWLKKKK